MLADLERFSAAISEYSKNKAIEKSAAGSSTPGDVSLAPDAVASGSSGNLPQWLLHMDLPTTVIEKLQWYPHANHAYKVNIDR